MKWLKNILSILGNGDHILVVVAVVAAVILCLIPFQVCLGGDTGQKKYLDLNLSQAEGVGLNPLARNGPKVVTAYLTQSEVSEAGLTSRDIGPKEMQYRYDLVVELSEKLGIEEKSKQEPKYEYAFSYGLFVHHYESKKANEGFENRMMAFERKGLVLSYFDNSYNEDTVFFGYGLHSDKYYSKHSKWWTRGNLYLGGLVGYGDKNPINCYGLGLGVYPTASLGYERYSIEMGVMPTFVWWALKVEF